AKRHAGDPAGLGIGVIGLQPIEGGGGVGQFPRPVVEQAFAPPHAAEIEAQHREPAPLKRVIQVIYHLIIHGAAELRMGMEDERYGGVWAALVVVAGLDSAGGAADIDFRHVGSASTPLSPVFGDSICSHKPNGKREPSLQNLTLPLWNPIPNLRLELFQTKSRRHSWAFGAVQCQAALHSTRDGGSCKR